jgi:hypothetical protein
LTMSASPIASVPMEIDTSSVPAKEVIVETSPDEEPPRVSAADKGKGKQLEEASGDDPAARAVQGTGGGVETPMEGVATPSAPAAVGSTEAPVEGTSSTSGSTPTPRVWTPRGHEVKNAQVADWEVSSFLQACVRAGRLMIASQPLVQSIMGMQVPRGGSFADAIACVIWLVPSRDVESLCPKI